MTGCRSFQFQVDWCRGELLSRVLSVCEIWLSGVIMAEIADFDITEVSVYRWEMSS